MELMVLVEDPQAATIRSIVAEASAQLAARGPPSTAASQPGGKQAAAAHVAATAAPATVQQARQAPAGPLWIAPAPVSVKMRLFCLPYAGGVSENVFAR